MKKNYYYKREDLLNHLIDFIEELENFGPNEQIFKNHESFLNS